MDLLHWRTLPAGRPHGVFNAVPVYTPSPLPVPTERDSVAFDARCTLDCVCGSPSQSYHCDSCGQHALNPTRWTRENAL